MENRKFLKHLSSNLIILILLKEQSGLEAGREGLRGQNVKTDSLFQLLS